MIYISSIDHSYLRVEVGYRFIAQNNLYAKEPRVNRPKSDKIYRDSIV